MKKVNSTIIITILIFFFLSIAIAYARVNAQQGIIEYLEERLHQHNVPVVEIKANKQFPTQIEIAIQSTSGDKRATPQDIANLHWVTREVLLANKEGFQIDSYIKVLLNTQNESIYWSKTNIRGEMNKVPDLPLSSIDDNSVERMIAQSMNMQELKMRYLHVETIESVQVIKMELEVSSSDEASQSASHIMTLLRALVTDINAKGGQIAVCQVEILNKDGDALFAYLLDLQFTSEIWWTSEDVSLEGYAPPPSDP